MEGAIYIAVAVILGGLSLALQKYAMKEGDAVNKNYVFQVTGAAAGLVLVALFSDLGRMPSSFLPWLLVGFVSILWLAGSLLRFMSVELIDLSLLSGLEGSRVLFVVILSSIFLREVVTVGRLAALVVLFAGLVAATWDKSLFGHLKSRGVQYGILSAFVVSINVVIDKFNIVNFDPMFYNWLGFVIPAVVFPLVTKIDFSKVRAIAKSKEGLAVGGAAIFALTSYYFVLLAYLVMDAQVAYPASRVMSVFALVLGFIFFGERTQLKRRLLGAAAAVAGAAMLVG